MSVSDKYRPITQIVIRQLLIHVSCAFIVVEIGRNNGKGEQKKAFATKRITVDKHLRSLNENCRCNKEQRSWPQTHKATFLIAPCDYSGTLLYILSCCIIKGQGRREQQRKKMKITSARVRDDGYSWDLRCFTLFFISFLFYIWLFLGPLLFPSFFFLFFFFLLYVVIPGTF